MGRPLRHVFTGPPGLRGGGENRGGGLGFFFFFFFFFFWSWMGRDFEHVCTEQQELREGE